jgi:beta-glucosidase
MAATHNTTLFYEAGYNNAKSVLESSWNWVFAPTVAVTHSYQWGRSYETMGSNATYVREYSKAYVAGAQ